MGGVRITLAACTPAPPSPRVKIDLNRTGTYHITYNAGHDGSGYYFTPFIAVADGRGASRDFCRPIEDKTLSMLLTVRTTNGAIASQVSYTHPQIQYGNWVTPATALVLVDRAPRNFIERGKRYAVEFRIVHPTSQYGNHPAEFVLARPAK